MPSIFTLEGPNLTPRILSTGGPPQFQHARGNEAAIHFRPRTLSGALPENAVNLIAGISIAVAGIWAYNHFRK